MLLKHTRIIQEIVIAMEVNTIIGSVLLAVIVVLIGTNIYTIMQLKALNNKWEDFKAAFSKFGIVL